MADTRTSLDHPRPAPPRQDGGYFGPDSVSWRLFADPSSKLGGVAAILLQALNPHMMRLFDSVSVIDADPLGRSERGADAIASTRAELESVGALEANIYHSLSKPSIEQLKRLRPGLFTGSTMAFAGVAGLGMYVWTVNGALQQRQMLRDDVHGIISDAPELAVGSRDGMGRESGPAATLFDALMRFVVVV